jgi:hypothetical protein
LSRFAEKECLLKKLMILVALLAMLLVAFAPMVLAQEEAQPSDLPADSEVTPSLAAPAPGSAVGCQDLYGYPTAFCMVNGDGLITLPDGSTAAVLVQPDGTAFVVDAEGNLILSGTSVPPSEDTAGGVQYDNAQGEPVVPVAPETGGQ